MLTSCSLFQTLFDKGNVGEEENARLVASIMQPDVPHPAPNAEEERI